MCLLFVDRGQNRCNRSVIIFDGLELYDLLRFITNPRFEVSFRLRLFQNSPAPIFRSHLPTRSTLLRVQPYPRERAFRVASLTK